VNNSISNIAVANITTGRFPQAVAINPKTDTVYVTFWNGSTFLAVINGKTDRIIDTLTNISNTTPLVNSETNMIFVGNEIINGSTNTISGRIDSNLTFVALDEKRNIAYASQTALSGQNGTTTVYKINGTTYDTIGSQNFTGQMLNNFVFDTNASALYATDCTESFACSPSYIVAINASSVALESKLEVDEIFFAIAFNQQTNMVYVTSLQNLLLVINGSNNQLVTKVPVMAYANELYGIAVDPFRNEIFLTGGPYCDGSPQCYPSITLYVLSSTNYGIFTTFVGSTAQGGPVILQFDPANNETYMAFGFSNFVLAVKIPQYLTGLLLP